MAKETYESTLAKLEKIVDKLEDDNIDLDQALSSFEQGIKLSKQCVKTLDEAKKRVEILIKESHDLFKTEPFSFDDEDDESL